MTADYIALLVTEYLFIVFYEAPQPLLPLELVMKNSCETAHLLIFVRLKRNIP